MKFIDKFFLFFKKSTCYNCKHYDICKFANKRKDMSKNTFCSNKKELFCRNKK